MGESEDGSARVGIVAIGRNEGERLAACLASLPADLPAVYVDSASEDGSADRARALGFRVIELDPERPLSAARARNAGFRELLRAEPGIHYVQFLDGDCELAAGWLDRAAERLASDASLGAVCGRRRERAPDASPYHRLIDMEWDTPSGRVDRFGGDVMIRAGVLVALGGYDESLIAGEDPELARRLRSAGHGIERLDAEMSRHDAALSRFSQWWTRQVRAGHAAAEAWSREGGSPADPLGRRVASILFWGVLLPAAVLVLSAAAGPLGLLGLLLYPALALRIFRRQRSLGRGSGDAARYAASCIEGKFAEALGLLRCFAGHARRGRARGGLIEYK